MRGSVVECGCPSAAVASKCTVLFSEHLGQTKFGAAASSVSPQGKAAEGQPHSKTFGILRRMRNARQRCGVRLSLCRCCFQMYSAVLGALGADKVRPRGIIGLPPGHSGRGTAALQNLRNSEAHAECAAASWSAAVPLPLLLQNILPPGPVLVCHCPRWSPKIVHRPEWLNLRS